MKIDGIARNVKFLEEDVSIKKTDSKIVDQSTNTEKVQIPVQTIKTEAIEAGSSDNRISTEVSKEADDHISIYKRSNY